MWATPQVVKRTSFDQLILWHSEEIELDSNLLESLILVESSGSPRAYRFEKEFWERYLKGKPMWAKQEPRRVSASYGLMQLMYPVAWEQGFRGTPESLFEPSINLRYGCKLLSSLRKWAGGFLPSMLAAYNGGKRANAPTDVPLRNAGYVGKVKKRYEEVASWNDLLAVAPSSKISSDVPVSF